MLMDAPPAPAPDRGALNSELVISSGDFRTLFAYDPASSAESTVLRLSRRASFGAPALLFAVSDPEPREPASFTIPLSEESYRKLDAMTKPVSIERLESFVRAPAPRIGKPSAMMTSDRKPSPPKRTKPSGESKLARRLRRGR